MTRAVFRPPHDRGVAVCGVRVRPACTAAAARQGRRARPPAPRSRLPRSGSNATSSNGLVVLTLEDHSVPTVTFWQIFRVGSRNERPGITGISHFFEHMMFNGSANVPPKEYDRILESNGGYSNAFTDRDMTAYYEDIASDRLDVVFRLDSDRMASLSLLPEQLKSEVEVVKEERRMRVDDSIFGMLDEQLYATAFVASPYGWPVIGWMKDLERITREECAEYFRTYYAPNNCILVLVGDFDTKAALAQIEKAFGSIPAQAPPVEPTDAEPEQRGERRVAVHYPAEAITLQMGYKAPGVKSDDAAALEVLGTILGGGESSRLHQALVVEQELALSAGGFFGVRLGPALFEIYAELRPGKTALEGEKAIDGVLAKLVAEGPAERELQKAKNQLEARFVKRLKTNNGAGEALGFHEHVVVADELAKRRKPAGGIDAVGPYDRRYHQRPLGERIDLRRGREVAGRARPLTMQDRELEATASFALEAGR